MFQITVAKGTGHYVYFFESFPLKREVLEVVDDAVREFITSITPWPRTEEFLVADYVFEIKEISSKYKFYEVIRTDHGWKYEYYVDRCKDNLIGIPCIYNGE